MFNKAQQHKNLGNDFYRKKLYSQAIQEYTKAIQIQQDPIFYSNRSSCYFALQNYIQAKQDAEKSFQLNSQFDKGYYKAGKACKKLGEFQLASQYFNKGFELSKDPIMRQEIDDTNLLTKYLIQIEEHIQKNQYKDALRKINNILEQIEPQISFIQKKIEILCIQGEIQKAQQYLNQMETFIKKQQQEIYYYLQGLIFENMHKRQEAKSNYQIGLKKNPDLIFLQRKLKRLISIDKLKEQANQLFKKGNYNQALQTYLQILNQIQNNLIFEAIICSNISSCYKKLNNKKKALEFIKKAIKSNPKYDTAFYRKGLIEKEMKNYEDAEQSFQQAQGLNQKLNLQKLIKECSIQNKKNNVNDFYKILSVDKNASQDQIKKQYKKLALKFHPDRNNDSQEQKQEAEKKFKQISEAYDTLGDPEKRKKYDMGFNNNSNEFQNFENSQSNGFQNFDFGNNQNNFQNFTFSSSNGQQIDPQLLQMLFKNFSSNNFNFMNEGSNPSSKTAQSFQFFN